MKACGINPAIGYLLPDHTVDLLLVLLFVNGKRLALTGLTVQFYEINGGKPCLV